MSEQRENVWITNCPVCGAKVMGSATTYERSSNYTHWSDGVVYHGVCENGHPYDHDTRGPNPDDIDPYDH